MILQLITSFFNKLEIKLWEYRAISFQASWSTSPKLAVEIQHRANWLIIAMFTLRYENAYHVQHRLWHWMSNIWSKSLSSVSKTVHFLDKSENFAADILSFNGGWAMPHIVCVIWATVLSSISIFCKSSRRYFNNFEVIDHRDYNFLKKNFNF